MGLAAWAIAVFCRVPTMPGRVAGAIEPARASTLEPARCEFAMGLICPAGKEAREAGPALLVKKCWLFAAAVGKAPRFTGRFTGCRLAWVGVTGSLPCIRLPCRSMFSFTGWRLRAMRPFAKFCEETVVMAPRRCALVMIPWRFDP
jgi:hypothetical protein